MNETEAREPQVPHPATAIASHRVHPEKVDAYIKAQTAITDAARRFRSFVGTEVLDPVPISKAASRSRASHAGRSGARRGSSVAPHAAQECVEAVKLWSAVGKGTAFHKLCGASPG
jgi:hypothetical protein